MKIVFMGTPEFAVPCLTELYKNGHVIEAVITQPDKPKGRGKKVLPTPVKVEAQKLGLKVLQPESIRNNDDFLDYLENLNVDCIIVVAYGQILPKSILEIPPYGCINVHASLLPKYRGAAPINWAIINGESKTGITTMFMSEGLDTGDMIFKDEVDIEINETAGELHDKLAKIGSNTLIKTLELVENGKAKSTPQDDSISSYAIMLNKSLGEIDWDKGALNIHNQVRGLNPWPVAYTKYKGAKVKIWKTSIVESSSIKHQNGEIIDVSKAGILVSTMDNIIQIEEIQFPNSRKMTVDEYTRGNEIEIGTKLGE